MWGEETLRYNDQALTSTTAQREETTERHAVRFKAKRGRMRGPVTGRNAKTVGWERKVVVCIDQVTKYNVPGGVCCQMQACRYQGQRSGLSACSRFNKLGTQLIRRLVRQRNNR